MKKNLILMAIAFALTTATYAQDGFHAGVQIGYYLVGMVNGPATTTTTSSLNPFTGFHPKFEFQEGLVVGYGFAGMFSVQAELNFLKEGQSAKADDGTVRDINLSYTQVPILFKFRTPGVLLHYYILAGPQFNFLSSATISDPRVPQVPDAVSHFNKTDEGIAFGTGMEVDVWKLFFTAGIRAYYGFSDPNAVQFKLPSTSGDYKPSHNYFGGIQIGAEYKF